MHLVPKTYLFLTSNSFQRRCRPASQQVCAFDLLATVAGKLLSEGDNSPPSLDTSSGKEQPSVVEDPIFKEENEEDKPVERSSCHERKFILTDLVSEAPSSKFCLNEIPCKQNGASDITTSYGSEKVSSAVDLLNDDCKLRIGIVSPTKNVESLGFKQPPKCGPEVEERKYVKMDFGNDNNLSIGDRGDMCSLNNAEVWNRKPSTAASVVNSVKFPLFGDHSPRGSFPVHYQENVKLVNRDNDEKSSECKETGTRNEAFRPPQRVGDRRFKKTLASKHCKGTSNSKDDDHYNAGEFLFFFCFFFT